MKRVAGAGACVLCLHVGPDGLTIHPFKVERVCRDWKLNPAATVIEAPGWWARHFGRRLWRFTIDEQQERPWFEPVSGSIDVQPIEKNIVIV